jgi:hypothetical protein
MLTLDHIEEWGRVKKVQVHMMKDRGFEIKDEADFLEASDLQIGITLFSKAKQLKQLKQLKQAKQSHKKSKTTLTTITTIKIILTIKLIKTIKKE